MFEKDLELPCQEHAENTCCKVADIKRIYNRIAAYDGSENQIDDGTAPDDPSQMLPPPPSYQLKGDCKQLTTEIFCSVCDGDVGTYKRKGICPQLCETWHYNCMGQEFEVVDEEDRSPEYAWLDFYKVSRRYKESKPVRLYELQNLTTSEDFCKAMGFPVNNLTRMEHRYDEAPCYAGIPSAKYLKLNQGKRSWSKPKN